MYNPKSKVATEFIHHGEILESIAYAKENKTNRELIESIIAKARECKGVTHREAAVLLECELDDLNQEMFKLARDIKQKFY
ncbi:MAG: [Selenomonadales bacterium]|nr:[FeFe] hydrogenase H-cluster radical SAM maturase HydG [Selenomonadales bacterium]